MQTLKFPYIRIFMLLILIIGGTEYCIMIFFEYLDIDNLVPSYIEALLDAFLLIIISSPLIYRSIIRPLAQKNAASTRELAIIISALNHASDCIMITDYTGVLTYVNQTFTTLTGYSAQEVIGKNPNFLQSGKQGKQFYKNMWGAINSLGEWRGELWNCRKDGTEYLETLHIKKVHTQYASEPYYIGIIVDITLQKKHAMQLAHIQKMASIGTLVGGIAHNFNNLLAGIIGNAYLAKNKNNPKKTNERLALIERVSFDASDMVKSLLVFARNHAPKKKNTAIVPILNQAIQTARLGLPDDIDFKVQFPENNPMLYCDAVEIQQVMLNLISNAHDALPEQGKRMIHIDIEQIDWRDCPNKQDCGTCSSDILVIKIQDSGCGISEENLPLIFDPFFTTKEVGMGTGLGLSTTFSTIQAHGGNIHVLPLQPQGTCFGICLPISFSPEQIKTTAHPIQQASSASTILIVDDEIMVCNTLQQILESLGYKTITAHQGQEAIDMMQKHTIDLVISDIVMPVLDGISSVSIMRENHPHLPVIFITGYEEKHGSTPNNEQTRCISKPFEICLLSEEVAHLLSNAKDNKQ